MIPSICTSLFPDLFKSGSFMILDNPCLNAVVEAGVPDTDQVRGWAPGSPGSVFSVKANLSDQLPV